MQALQQFLRPEFINRVDDVICFNHLTEENFKAIAKIMLEELKQTLADKGLTFVYGDDLLDYLTKKSYSQTYGARNLRRLIQRELEDAIATRIIDSYMAPITHLQAVVEDDKLELVSL